MNTQIEAASGSALTIIENLMQLYNYDLSQWYPIPLTADGRFMLRPKAAYWAREDVHPYLIHHDGELAGFAVIDGDVYQPDSDHSLGYFFIARRFRGAGIADIALRDILARHPGRWEIYHLAINIAAARFWQRVLPPHDPQLQREACQLDGDDCVLFRFNVDAPHDDTAPWHKAASPGWAGDAADADDDAGSAHRRLRPTLAATSHRQLAHAPDKL